MKPSEAYFEPRMSAEKERSLLDAVRERDLHKVQNILENDPDVIKRWNQNSSHSSLTPCHKAAHWGYVDILQLLLNRGANVNMVNKASDTPLHEAAVSLEGVKCIELLLKSGADIKARNNHGYTPFQLAILQKRKECAECLLRNAENEEDIVNTVDNSGFTPLHSAAQSGSVDILKFVLSHGANVNVVDKKGDTPLHIAAREGYVNRIKLLLKFGANIKAKNNNGKTPYRTALEDGHKKAADYLRNAANGEDEELMNPSEVPDVPMVESGSSSDENLSKTSSSGMRLKNPWKKEEVKEFMTSEDETKRAIYEKTSEYVDREVLRKLEGDSELKAVTSLKPSSREEIFKIKSQIGEAMEEQCSESQVPDVPTLEGITLEGITLSGLSDEDLGEISSSDEASSPELMAEQSSKPQVVSKYPDQVTKIINADGGFVEIDDITVRIGPGCLAKDTEITLINRDPWDIVSKSLLDLGLLQDSLRVVEFRPDGLKFLKPVDLTISFEGAVSDSKLFLFHGSWNPQYKKIVWEPKTLGISQVRDEKTVFNAKIDSFCFISYFFIGTLTAMSGMLSSATKWLLSHFNQSFTCRAYSFYRRSSLVAGTIDISVVILSEFVEENEREENIKQLRDHREAGFDLGEKGMLKPVHTDRLFEMSIHFPEVEKPPFKFRVDRTQLNSVGFLIDYFRTIAVNSPASGNVKISEVERSIADESLWNMNICEAQERMEVEVAQVQGTEPDPRPEESDLPMEVEGSSQCGLLDGNSEEASCSDATGSQEPQKKRNKSPLSVNMCKTCEANKETPLSSNRDTWSINMIELSCFVEICELLDLATKSNKRLMVALGGFSQKKVASIEMKYKGEGGVGIAKEVLGQWGSRNNENNVGHFKKILKDIMQRADVLDVIKKWEKMSVCHGHGCGIKWNAQ